jgi:hypothetical protein
MVSRGQTTIRDWIKTGTVRAHRNVMGHWMIDRDSLLAHASREGTSDGPRRVGGASVKSSEPPPHPHPESVPSLSDALIHELKDEIAHLRLLLKEERERSKVLEAERTQHMAEMRALLSGKNDNLLSRWLRK